MTHPIAILLFAFVVMAGSAAAGDWPQWRGPQRNGVAAETGLLAEWEHPPPVVWRADHLGDGYAGVAVAGGRVFTQGRQGNDVFCIALDAATGAKLWSRQIGDSRRNAMSTPTIHDGLVYALDPDGELSCLTAEQGELVWRKDVATDFAGRLMSGRGHGESPLIDGDRVICTPGGPDALMVALHRITGDVIWKATMPAIGDKGRDGAAMSSAVVTEAAGHRQYVQLTGRGLVGIDAASGQFLWGYNDISNGTVNIPTPLVQGNLVFSANGYNAGSVLLRLEPGGDTGVTAKEVYRLRGTDFQNHHGGVAELLGDHLYGGHGSNNGLPTCLEFATGKILWKRRGPGIGSAAVAAADGHLLFRYQNGVVAWMDASPRGYSLRGTFEIPGAGGDSWSHPAIADGKLFLREQSTLWVYDLVHPGSGDAPVSPAGETTALSPELADLRAKGHRVENLPTKVTDWNTATDRLRFYRFAISDGDEPVSRPVVITVSEDQLTADGLLHEDALQSLGRLSEPFVLNVGETHLSDAGLKQIAGLNSLIGLNVELCERLTDAGFAHLAAASKLRVLIAPGTAISAAGLQPLTTLPHLAALDLEVCDQVTNEACTELGRMPALRGLILKKTAFEPVRISAAGLERLGNLTRLEVLNLYANDVTDDGMNHLRKLTRLEELNLSLVGITDQGLAHLADLKELRRLELMYAEGFAGPTLTDAGLRHLSNLTKLQTLNLTGTRLTDSGLLPLADLPELESLDLIKTPTTPDGITRFRSLRPNVRVKFNTPAAK